MDGRRAWLRNWIVASLATTSVAANLVADDFIRPPAKNRPAPHRAGAITQPTVTAPSATSSLPIAQPSTTPTTAAVPQTPAGAETAKAPQKTSSGSQLELDAPKPATTNPMVLLSRPTTTPVPAQVTSGNKSSSVLQWQPRGGRPSLSVDQQRGVADPSTTASVPEQVSLDGVPQVPAAAAAAPEVRLVVPVRPEDAAQAEQLEQRRELAQKISSELIGDSPSGQGDAANAIEPGPGWQAIGEELQQRVRKCEELLARKAYLSAMQEADQAIVRLVRVLDLKQNHYASEPSWAQGVQALREAQEFTSVNRIATDPELFTRLVQSHETPVLKDTNVADITPLVAAQHYRAYAEQRLIEAAQGHPWFCELYYCLGRALQSQAESSADKRDLLLHQSLTYFRAAQAIDPSHATNANQLGYVLLRLDRPSEALNQLQHVAQLPNCPLETWQNLAQASSRLGDAQQERWAIDNYMAAKARGQAPSGPMNTLVQLTEEQFRALSPRSSGPSGSLPINMMTGPQGPASNYTNNAGNVPAQAITPEQPGRTAILPRTGLFR